MAKGSPPLKAIPKLVLFDMDDTIFDHSGTCRTALTALWNDVPALQRRPVDEVYRTYCRLLETIFSPLAASLAEHERARDERFRRLFEFVGAPVTTDEAHAYSIDYRARYQAARAPVPGAPELLGALRGKVSVGVVSNNHQDEQLEKLKALGLLDRVDFVVTSQLAGVAKPDPAIFRRALVDAGRTPEEAVMVGDNWAADILGARAAGISAVWFDRRGNAPPLSRDVRVLRSFVPLDTALRVVLDAAETGPG